MPTDTESLRHLLWITAFAAARSRMIGEGTMPYEKLGDASRTEADEALADAEPHFLAM